MISLSAMSSSELRRLKDGIENGSEVAEFIDAATNFLVSHPLDGGADEDLVYMVGRKLTTAGVWEVLPPKIFHAVWLRVGTPTINMFLQSAPEYLLSVKQHLITPRDETVVLQGQLKMHHFGGAFVPVGPARGHAGSYLQSMGAAFKGWQKSLLIHDVAAFNKSVMLGDTENAAYVVVKAPSIRTENLRGYFTEPGKNLAGPKGYKKRRLAPTGKFK